MVDLVIYGAGGFGKEMHEIFMDVFGSEGNGRLVGFLDDTPALSGADFRGSKVVGGVEWLADHPDVQVVIAVGNPKSRRKVVTKIGRFGPRTFPNLVHPTSWLGSGIEFGEGVTIAAGCTISPELMFGSHVFINKNVTMGHNVILRDFVTVAPSANIMSGSVVEEEADLGTNCTVLPNSRIGQGSVVGAGAVVTKDVPPGVTVVGIPARVLQKKR